MSEQPFPAGCWCVITADDPKICDQHAQVGIIVQMGERAEVMFGDLSWKHGMFQQEVVGSADPAADAIIKPECERFRFTYPTWPVRYLRRIDDDEADTLIKAKDEDVPLLDDIVEEDEVLA